MSSPTGYPTQPVFPITVPEYRPELYLTHANTSLQSLLSAETSVASPTSSVSSEYELYHDDAEFYAQSSPLYYPQFDDSTWSQYGAPSSPIDATTLPFFETPMQQYPQVQPSPTKRQRKLAPEPCNCMYCLPTSAPLNAPSNHQHTGIPRISGGGVIAPSPPLNLQFQIDTQPKPVIIGHHGLGKDAAFLHQAEQEQMVQQQQGLFDGEMHFYAHGY